MPSVGYSFSGRNERAQKKATAWAARRVTVETQKTKEAIAALTTRSIREGIPVYEAARMMRGMIGLNRPQALAAMNYRQSLIDAGWAVGSPTFEKEMAKYIAKKIKYRAEMIGRTETKGALERGNIEAGKEAQRQGLFDNPVKTLMVSGLAAPAAHPGGGMCEDCAVLDGKSLPLDEPFEFNGEEFQGPPFHPGCSCSVAITEKKGAAAALDERVRVPEPDAASGGGI